MDATNILCIYFDFLVEFGRDSHANSHPRPTGQPGMGSRFLGGPAIPIWSPPRAPQAAQYPQQPQQPLNTRMGFSTRGIA